MPTDSIYSLNNDITGIQSNEMGDNIPTCRTLRNKHKVPEKVELHRTFSKPSLFLISTF